MVHSDNNIDRQIREAKQLYVDEKFNLAFETFAEIAGQGNSFCNSMTGFMYLFGEGIEKDFEKAEHHLRIAAADNDRRAMLYLGKLFYIKKEYDDSISWLKKSAFHDFSPALYNLGWVYDRSPFIKNNKELAFRYFEKAAKLGHIGGLGGYSIKLMKGHCGTLNRLKGLFIFLKTLVVGIKISWGDNDIDKKLDERLFY
jgi:TPR repeat protein